MYGYKGGEMPILYTEQQTQDEQYMQCYYMSELPVVVFL